MSQTDFGNIYFHTPQHTDNPRTVEELASTLQHYHKLGQQVRIRNTGHSVNGQTLTDGIQINIGGITGITFDQEHMEVTAGAGNSWDDVLQAINFPKYCLPLFPNNPGQKIKIGGTASVGGCGPYSTRYGGLWNHIKRLTLVTMAGDIIKCELDGENDELLKYSLGGFGRIGVIAEVTVAVVPSQTRVLSLALVYHDLPTMIQDIHTLQSSADPQIDSLVSFSVHLDNWLLENLPINLHHVLGITIEIESESDVHTTSQKIKDISKCVLMMSNHIGDRNGYDADFSLHSQPIDKQAIVYYYPRGHRNQTPGIHPWSDYILPEQSYPEFIENTNKLITQYDIRKHLVKESFFHNIYDFPLLPSYILTNLNQSEYPLSLDIPGHEYTFGTGIMPTIPKERLSDVQKLIQELTELAYSLGGKRYLYGVHDLTKAQVVQQFGENTIAKWNQLKTELDPKRLLNIGVIEHLD